MAEDTIGEIAREKTILRAGENYASEFLNESKFSSIPEGELRLSDQSVWTAEYPDSTQPGFKVNLRIETPFIGMEPVVGIKLSPVEPVPVSREGYAIDSVEIRRELKGGEAVERAFVEVTTMEPGGPVSGTLSIETGQDSPEYIETETGKRKKELGKPSGVTITSNMEYVAQLLNSRGPQDMAITAASLMLKQIPASNL